MQRKKPHKYHMWEYNDVEEGNIFLKDVTVVNNAVLCIWKSVRVDHITRKISIMCYDGC